MNKNENTHNWKMTYGGCKTCDCGVLWEAADLNGKPHWRHPYDGWQNCSIPACKLSSKCIAA